MSGMAAGLALLSLALATVFPAGPALAAEIGLRVGSHADFGRVVFDMPPGTTYELSNDRTRVTVRFSPEAVLSGTVTGRPPRNVQRITLSEGGVALLLNPGSHLRPVRLGDKLVLDAVDDVLAPKTAASTGAPSQPAPIVSEPKAGVRRSGGLATAVPPDNAHRDNAVGPAAPALAEPPPSAPADPPASRSPITAEASGAPPSPPGPMALLAKVASSPGAAGLPAPETSNSPPAPAVGSAATRSSGRTILLPFSSGVGAAAFRRGDSAVVVFDERRPIDLSALREEPIFASAGITLLTSATVLRMTLPLADGVKLARTEAGWMISVLPGQTAPGLRPIRPEQDDGRLKLLADKPGRVVSVPDPMSGGAMLVGTQTQPGQGMPVDRRTADFVLLSTWQGVVVMPSSDALSLRPITLGFLLSGDAERALAVSAPDAQTLALADASGLSRRFDFPAASTEGLLRRLQSATASAAAAPPQSRTALRLAVAQAMIALGLGAEAQSVLILAGMEDGRVASDPDAIGLSAIAALLAGRVDEADGLEDARLSDPQVAGADEIALWRAVRLALREEFSPRAAPIFAATLKLLQTYPQSLRARLAPLVVETMAMGGERAAATAALAAWKDEAGLALATAMIAEAGDPPAALAIYDRLAQESDRLSRARAATRAAELRLTIGAATPAQTADGLEKLIYAWRGDGREVALRLRVAQLRGQAGQPRRALALLRETLQLWPDSSELIRPRMIATFGQAVAEENRQNLQALDLVALAEENADLIPTGAAGQVLAGLLADRLLALDLPRRAVPVLEKLAAAAPEGVVRAEFGGWLATARLQQADAAGALSSLSMSVMEGPMPPALLESRTLTYARAAAAIGQIGPAEQALAALATPAAETLRASLLETARDWKGAAAALGVMVARNIPPTGPLNEDQGRLLLRLASAAAQAGDEPMLTSLRLRDATRLPPGGTSEMFRLLTVSPVLAVSDLPRAAQEARLARSLAGAGKPAVSAGGAQRGP